MTQSQSKPADLAADELMQGVLAGKKLAVAKLFNLLEDRRPAKVREAAAYLDFLYAHGLGRAHVIGVTGPPGAGKSCLASRLIKHLRAEGKSIGVIAIDPSSKLSRGALLGDRIRMDYDVSDDRVFVRSMANRGDLGGVSDRTFGGSIVLRAAFDVVLLETVGVGQAEADVVEMVDTTVFVVQPGSGDMLQFMKAGIMEVPDLLVVNKADQPTARRTYNDVRSGLANAEPPTEWWRPTPLLVSAQEDTGMEEMLKTAREHYEALRGAGELEAKRRRQASHWVVQNLERMYGRVGIEKLGGAAAIVQRVERSGGDGPFGVAERLAESLQLSFEPGGAAESAAG